MPIHTLGISKQQLVEITKALIKYERYLFMKDQTDLRKSILLISSDMDELLGLSDRVYVLSEGRIAGALIGDEMNPERIMQCIMDSTKGKE